MGVVGRNNGGSSRRNPTTLNRNVVPLLAHNKGHANAQPNRAASTSAPARCFKCGEPSSPLLVD